MAPPVNYLPVEMQEQSNWREEEFIGDETLFFFLSLSRKIKVFQLALQCRAPKTCLQRQIISYFSSVMS